MIVLNVTVIYNSYLKEFEFPKIIKNSLPFLQDFQVQ